MVFPYPKVLTEADTEAPIRTRTVKTQRAINIFFPFQLIRLQYTTDWHYCQALFADNFSISGLGDPIPLPYT
jgi:hypothetical protein